MGVWAGTLKTAEATAKSVAAFIGKPLGIDTENQTWSWENFRDAWVNHPVESFAAIFPFGASFLKRKGITPSETQVRELVDSAVKDEKTPLAQELKKEMEEGPTPPKEELDFIEGSGDASKRGATLGQLEAEAPVAGVVAATRLEANRAAGAAFEQAVGAGLKQGGLKVSRQITIRTGSGVRTRLDFLTRDPLTGEIGCIECKASLTAPLTENQNIAFPDIGQSGGTIVGKGKPDFPGGTQIPPTGVKIIRGTGDGEK